MSVKRILAIDGGGIRGVLALEILRKIEACVRQRHDAALHEYFDLIAGTSTGAIIASSLAWGMTVEQVANLYRDLAPEIFTPNSWYRRHKSRFCKGRFENFLRHTFVEADGKPANLGSSGLQTLLLIVMRNATTGSTWPICNNPDAMYNDRSLPDCNLDLPLWQIVRASTAAPTFFEPELLNIGNQKFHFIDGGISPYNNPAFIAFLFATLPEYRIEFETGEDCLLLVSVGTGMVRGYPVPIPVQNMHLLNKVKFSFNLLIGSVTAHEDMLCRIFGQCMVGDSLDSEIGDLKNCSLIDRKLFTYLRFNRQFEKSEVIHQNAGNIMEIDNLYAMDYLKNYGSLYAESAVKEIYFS